MASNGKDVTILEAGARILTRGVPEQVAVLIADRHIKGGVQIICGVRITEIQQTKAKPLSKQKATALQRSLDTSS